MKSNILNSVDHTQDGMSNILNSELKQSMRDDNTNLDIYQNLQNYKIAKSQYLDESSIINREENNENEEQEKMEMKMELSSISDNNEKTQNPIESSIFKLNNQRKEDPENLKSYLRVMRD